MKRLLLTVSFVLTCSAFAFAGNDDITVDRPANIFTTAVTSSSSSMRAVRIGRDASGIPSVVWNVPGYVPVVLGNVAGKLTYNGVALATDTFVGNDISVVQDLTVGQDAAITRNETVGGTLGVTGATSLSTLSASGASTLVGAVYMGAPSTKSTAAANGTITAGAGLVATTSVVAGTTVTGGTGLIATAGPVTLWTRTKADHDANSNTYSAGQVFGCSDCTHKLVYVESPGVMKQITGASW